MEPQEAHAELDATQQVYGASAQDGYDRPRVIPSRAGASNAQHTADATGGQMSRNHRAFDVAHCGAAHVPLQARVSSSSSSNDVNNSQERHPKTLLRDAPSSLRTAKSEIGKGPHEYALPGMPTPGRDSSQADDGVCSPPGQYDVPRVKRETSASPTSHHLLNSTEQRQPPQQEQSARLANLPQRKCNDDNIVDASMVDSAKPPLPPRTKTPGAHEGKVPGSRHMPGSASLSPPNPHTPRNLGEEANKNNTHASLSTCAGSTWSGTEGKQQQQHGRSQGKAKGERGEAEEAYRKPTIWTLPDAGHGVTAMDEGDCTMYTNPVFRLQDELTGASTDTDAHATWRGATETAPPPLPPRTNRSRTTRTSSIFSPSGHDGLRTLKDNASGARRGMSRLWCWLAVLWSVAVASLAVVAIVLSARALQEVSSRGGVGASESSTSATVGTSTTAATSTSTTAIADVPATSVPCTSTPSPFVLDPSGDVFLNVTGSHRVFINGVPVQLNDTEEARVDLGPGAEITFVRTQVHEGHLFYGSTNITGLQERLAATEDKLTSALACAEQGMVYKGGSCVAMCPKLDSCLQANCSAASNGTLRYTSGELEVCDGNIFHSISALSIGLSPLNPARSCQELKGLGYKSGVYYIGSGHLGRAHACDMTANPARDLGGAGGEELGATADCTALKEYFGRASGSYWIRVGEEVAKLYCDVDTGDIAGDGSSAAFAGYSCKSIRARYSNLPDGDYWITAGGATPFQVTCVGQDVEVQLLGSAFSSTGWIFSYGPTNNWYKCTCADALDRLKGRTGNWHYGTVPSDQLSEVCQAYFDIGYQSAGKDLTNAQVLALAGLSKSASNRNFEVFTTSCDDDGYGAPSGHWIAIEKRPGGSELITQDCTSGDGGAGQPSSTEPTSDNDGCCDHRLTNTFDSFPFPLRGCASINTGGGVALTFTTNTLRIHE